MTGSSPGFCLHINLIVSQVPYYKGELITFDVVPENLPFLVGHGLVRLSPDFQVAGFSVTGQVLDSVKVGFEYCQFTIIRERLILLIFAILRICKFYLNLGQGLVTQLK